MLVGIDFDNTLVCYDGLFHRAAVEQGYLSPDVLSDKQSVRDALRRLGREAQWTELQGYVYGVRIAEAPPFAGVAEFLRQMHEAGVELAIVSHRTRFPYRGPQYDLHGAARDWLHRQRITLPAECGIAEPRVFFEETREAKFLRVASCRCDLFIDDLPEFLGDPLFPPGVGAVLFDPQQAYRGTASFPRFANWQGITEYILRQVAS